MVRGLYVIYLAQGLLFEQERGKVMSPSDCPRRGVMNVCGTEMLRIPFMQNFELGSCTLNLN